MRGAWRDEVFVAFFEEVRFPRDLHLHFTVDDDSPLRITVAVRGQVHPRLELEKDELAVFCLVNPRFRTVEFAFCFG